MYRRYDRGNILFRQGEPADEVFCISGAVVKLAHNAPAGRTTVVGVIGCGEFVGLSSVVGPGVHPYSAEIVTGGVVGCISAEIIDELMHAHPDFSRGLLTQVAREAHRGVRQAALLAHPRLAPRLAALLLELAGAADPSPCHTVVARGLGRKDLAGMCGVGHEAIVRCITRWKKIGIVASSGGAVTILEPDALVQIAAG